MRILTAVLVCAVAAAAATPAFAGGDVTATLARGGKLLITGPTDGVFGSPDGLILTMVQGGDLSVTGVDGTTVNGQASVSFAGVKSLRCVGVQNASLTGLSLSRCDLAAGGTGGTWGTFILDECEIGTVVATRLSNLIFDNCAVDSVSAKDCPVVSVDAAVGLSTQIMAGFPSNTFQPDTGGSRIGALQVVASAKLLQGYGPTNLGIGDPSLATTSISGRVRLVNVRPADRLPGKPPRALINVAFTGPVSVQSKDQFDATQCTFAKPVVFRGDRSDGLSALGCTFSARVTVRSVTFFDATGSTFAVKPKLVSVEQTVGLPPGAKHEAAGAAGSARR